MDNFMNFLQEISSDKVIQQVSDRYGGCRVYIANLKKNERNLEIIRLYEKYSKKNNTKRTVFKIIFIELSCKYEISIRIIERVIKRWAKHQK